MKTNIPLHAGMEYLLDTGKHEIIAVKNDPIHDSFT